MLFAVMMGSKGAVVHHCAKRRMLFAVTRGNEGAHVHQWSTDTSTAFRICSVASSGASLDLTDNHCVRSSLDVACR